jgi:hypothetical protein
VIFLDEGTVDRCTHCLGPSLDVRTNTCFASAIFSNVRSLVSKNIGTYDRLRKSDWSFCFVDPCYQEDLIAVRISSKFLKTAIEIFTNSCNENENIDFRCRWKSCGYCRALCIPIKFQVKLFGCESPGIY